MFYIERKKVKNVVRRHWLSKIKFTPVCCNMRRNFTEGDYLSGAAVGYVASNGNGRTLNADNNNNNLNNSTERDKLMHQNNTNNIPLVC